MSLSKSEGDESKSEIHIAVLVNKVRNGGSEDAFEKLRNYLDSYIKLFGRKYKIHGCDSDEIEQECLFALRYKAIEDFDSSRGKFRSFAILCIKRHLFSLIKGNNQQKRKVLNTSLSLDEDRSDDGNGENLSLINLITEDKPTAIEEIEKNENNAINRERLIAHLSPLEHEVLMLYLSQHRYDEIVEKLMKIFPQKNISKKTADNALQRVRSKAQNLTENIDWL